MVLMENHRTEPEITSPHVSSETAVASTRPHKTSPKPSKKTQIRRCIVTREEAHKSDLLRFVVNHEGVLHFDINQKLPGRGLYISPVREHLQTAIDKNLFSKSAKRRVMIQDDFMTHVETSLRQVVLNYIGLAKRASVLTSSLDKIIKFIKNNSVACYITSSSEESDGYRKVASKIGSSPIITEFTNEELSQVLSLENAVHLTIKQGELADTFLKKFNTFKNLSETKRIKAKKE